jgi:hypothetical protein
MKIDRFTRILEAYGTDEDNWPQDERHAARQLLQSSDECSAILESFSALDVRLDEYLPRHSDVSSQRILERLPRPVIDRIINWLIPDPGAKLWRPVMAGSLPLVLGLIIGSSTLGELPGLENSAENWEDELYLMALDDSAYPMSLDNE